MNTQTTFKIPDCVTSFIDGQWTAPSAVILPVINPATEQQIARVSEADAAETAAAVSAAQSAFERGTWSRANAATKREVFHRIIELTRENLDELAWLEALNSGLPLRYLRSRQLPRILRNFSFFADWLSQNTEKASMQDDDYLRFVVREPAGVAALISPWNAPLALASTSQAMRWCATRECVLCPLRVAPARAALSQRRPFPNSSGLILNWAASQPISSLLRPYWKTR